MDFFHFDSDYLEYRKIQKAALINFFDGLIRFVIYALIALCVVTTLIDLGYITGEIAGLVDKYTAQFLPFMGPHGVVRVNITSIVNKFINLLRA